MNDPKLEGIPINKRTACRVGTHVFVYSGASNLYSERSVPNVRCSCDTYSLLEWKKILGERNE